MLGYLPALSHQGGVPMTILPTNQPITLTCVFSMTDLLRLPGLAYYACPHASIRQAALFSVQHNFQSTPAQTITKIATGREGQGPLNRVLGTEILSASYRGNQSGTQKCTFECFFFFFF